MMSGTPSSAGLPPQRPPDAARSSRFHLLPLALLILAVLDLRTELLLLFDHITFTSFVTAIAAHPLAVLVLLAQPSLWRRYGGSRR